MLIWKRIARAAASLLLTGTILKMLLTDWLTTQSNPFLSNPPAEYMFSYKLEGMSSFTTHLPSSWLHNYTYYRCTDCQSVFISLLCLPLPCLVYHPPLPPSPGSCTCYCWWPRFAGLHWTQPSEEPDSLCLSLVCFS